MKTYFQDYPIPCPIDRTTELAAVATRLAKMDDSLQQRLINWGYAISDASLRCKFDTGLPGNVALPYPGAGI